MNRAVKTSSVLPTPAVKGMFQYFLRAYPAPNRSEADLPLEPWQRSCTRRLAKYVVKNTQTKAPQTPFRVTGRSFEHLNSPPPKTALSQARLHRGHTFDLVRRPEVSIPESWRTLSRNLLQLSTAPSRAVCFCSTSAKPALCICSAAALKRLVLTASIARKRNACASGTPSAPVCRNSMCALTFPKTVLKAISPNVPSGIGPLTSRAAPPVNERR